MKVKFYSYVRGDSNIMYEADATYIDNGYKFLDKQNEGTYVFMKPINSREILLKRTGNINSEISFIEGKKTKAMFASDQLTFSFEVLTYNIKVSSSNISFEYDYFYQNDLVGHIRIVLLIKE